MAEQADDRQHNRTWPRNAGADNPDPRIRRSTGARRTAVGTRTAAGSPAGDSAAGDLTAPAPRSVRRLGPLLGLASAVGLAVAALCLHATGGTPHAGTGPLTSYWVLLALGAGVGGCMLAAKYRVRQEERPGMSAREERMVKVAVVGVFAIVAATVVSLIVIGSGRPTGAGPPVSRPSMAASPAPTAVPSTVPTDTSKHSSHPFDLRPFLITLLVLLIIGVIGLLVFLVLRYLPTRRSSGFTSAPPSAQAEEVRLTEAVNAGRLALQGDDTRAAVIACYAAMETSLAANGLGRQVSDSPSDLLDRAASAGLLTGPAPAALAELFREARYSSHPMGTEQLHQARSALDEISESLRAHQEQAQAEAEAWLLSEDDQPGQPKAATR